jgi:serine/threonine protein kinase/formylglycine-generating enzyme required for sulfatase activity/WD40 repeat protein
MSELESAPDLISDLAHEFAERWRCGERPAIDEYTRRYPDLAVQIRELFPALVMMEEFGSVAGQTREGNAGSVPRQLGEYRILREVGRGGMGVVYEAVQESLGRHVALKVLPLHHLMARAHLERFEREARAAARLHHTNIVPVFGIGVHEGIHYYAMQFIQGQTVDAVLEEVRRQRTGSAPLPATSGLTLGIAQGMRTDGPAEPLAALPSGSINCSTASGTSELTGPSEAQYFRAVARLGVQVAEALAYAHRQGIVHRDIKPSNVLLDTQGIAWITDFGLVKDDSGTNLTSPGDIVGTVRYMAPERFQEPGDARSDIYSLGATLYEMLTLTPAFHGDHRAELIDRVRHEEPARPRQLDPRIPRDLETVVLKAMAKEPARRYLSAEALADDLRRFLADRPVLARRATALERGWRWCRRNPTVALLTGSVVVLLTLLAAAERYHIAALNEKIALIEQAEKEKADKLWDMYLERAESSRLGGKPGRRFAGLDAVRLAAAIRPDLRLRNEAIALLILPDVRVARELPQAIPAGSAGLVFDPDLEYYARSDLQGTISVRRVADDQEVASLPGPGTHAYQMKFSPDGRFLSAFYHKDSAPQRIWQWSERRVVLEDAGEHFSPDSTRAAARRRDGAVLLHGLRSGQLAQRLGVSPALGSFHRCEFHPDSKQLALVTAQPPGLRIVDLDSGVIRDLPVTGPVQAAWQAAGTRLVAAGGGKMAVWDTRSWTPKRSINSPDANPVRACFSPRDDLLVSSGDGRLRLWDPMTGHQHLALPGEFLIWPQFSHGGELLAATREGPAVRLWEVAANREYRVLPTTPEPASCSWMVDFSPDGGLLATSGRGGVRLWDLATGRDLAHLPIGTCGGAVFAPDGRGLYTRGSLGVQRWPLRTEGTVLHVGPPEPVVRLPLAGHTGTLVDGAGGKLAATLRDEGEVLLVDPVDPGRAVRLAGHVACTNRIAVSPDGRWVAVRSWWDQPDKLRVSDTASGDIVWKHVMPKGGAEFSADGRRLVTSGDVCCIRKTGTWEPERTIAAAPGLGSVVHAAFAPDGVTLAIAYENRAVRLVDVRTGGEWATLPAPGLPVIDRLCFSRDGSRLACLIDGVGVQLWDLRGLRGRLAELGLDWDAPTCPAPTAVRGALTAAHVRHHEKPPTPLSAPFDADEAAAQQEEWARHLDVPVEIVNPAGMKLRLIPPGSYREGRYPSERGGSKDAYYIGVHEVTVGQFRQFVKETGYRTSGETSGQGGVHDGIDGLRPEQIWSHAKYAASDNHPVVQTTWYDAMAFCAWLGRKHGRTYRLPTLDEWHWAALAGAASRFPFGDTDEQLDSHYWHRGNSGLETKAVGTRKPNGWGLYDMYGNVWEHTYLWLRNRTFVDLATAAAGPRDGDEIKLAGGSYSDEPVRREYYAFLRAPRVPYFHFGFRVVQVGDLQATAR